jgi:hypothetical protein
MEEIGTSEWWRTSKEHSGVCVALETVCIEGASSIRDTLTDAKVQPESQQCPDCGGEGMLRRKDCEMLCYVA